MSRINQSIALSHNKANSADAPKARAADLRRWGRYANDLAITRARPNKTASVDKPLSEPKRKSGMIKLIKKWYDGEEYCISTPEFPIFPGIRYKRHWSSKLAHHLVRFWLDHWKILLPIIVTTTVTLFIYFDTKSTRETEKKEQHEVNRTIEIHSAPHKNSVGN